MNNLEKSIRLYDKFVRSIRFLNARMLEEKDITNKHAQYQESISEPLDETVKLLSKEHREAFDKITKVVDVFSGTIQIEDGRAVFENTEANVKSKIPKDVICRKCGEAGERFCYGQINDSVFDWGMFCLICEPHDF